MASSANSRRNWVEKARKSFVAGEPWWARVLVEGLRRRDPMMVYEWVERCVNLLLPLVKAKKKQARIQELQALTDLRREGADREQLWQLSEEIWYKPPTRDFAQTAVSKLYWAAGCEIGLRPEEWRHRVHEPIALVIDCSDMQADFFELCLVEYERIWKGDQ